LVGLFLRDPILAGLTTAQRWITGREHLALLVLALVPGEANGNDQVEP
jgi:hypothetical protein